MSETETEIAVLREMLRWLRDPERWVKKSYVSLSRLCLTAAHGSIRYQNPFYWMTWRSEESSLSLRTLADVIREQYPERARMSPGPGGLRPAGEIVLFNDHPDTVHADIVSVLEKSIARLEEAA
jgi:hypothetical protein